MNGKVKVVILGGGVAGLTAAHELLERGFAVELYEKRGIFGGKARSYRAAAVGGSGLKNLPGEHGFRIFPRFYRHVTDTMKRIPTGDPKKPYVHDHLVQVSRLGFATSRAPLFQLSAKMSLSLKDFIINRASFLDHHVPYGFNITEEDTVFFMTKLWQIMTSCRERWDTEYEQMSWWDFIEAEHRSRAYQNGFAGVVKALIACDPKKASAKTVGAVQAQLSLDLISPGKSYVSLLDGPTNEVWIDPWMEHLISLGLVYHSEAKVTRLHYSGGRIQGADVIGSGGMEQRVSGDYYIAALPVENMAELIQEELLAGDPELEKILALKKYVDWMNGIQFYLSEDCPMIHGHVSYMDAPWGLTSVSQRQFWKDVDWEKVGDGTVGGILSVDVANWEARGIVHPELTAKQCSPLQIKEEVWAQLKKNLNVDGEIVLSDEHLIGWHMDDDVMETSPHKEVNLEPLLINVADTWRYRPTAETRIPNLMLASDYVQTNTDLATMEGANEAARRAVNAILGPSRSSEHCTIWPMYEYEIFGFPVLSGLQEKDRERFNKGEKWDRRWIDMI